MIRHVIDQHTLPIPAILEIPSKDHPYDANKDSILRRAKVIYLFTIHIAREELDLSTPVSWGTSIRRVFFSSWSACIFLVNHLWF